ncbi:MAG: glycoside hydrolase [Candidatus Thermofonsia Clade 1 bacterium]|uniref:Glycoside hydrolase n=1 Tax=Candidatus Thermofonsia Clade 1 bacterium TaxID=2364210 RepID=A0A2M8P3Z6_9CHLR|nr:MAG: glycoside hydrolase [Candidatus Thermofonsia Clade 1 bacterium]
MVNTAGYYWLLKFGSALIISALIFAPFGSVSAAGQLTEAQSVYEERGGAFSSHVYPNLLAELGIPQSAIQARIEQVWHSLFYGDPQTERVYFPVGEDMAYILDVYQDFVHSEGISYGMMIAVQLDKQEEFNRLWKWARTYMYHTDPRYYGFLSWKHATDGTRLSYDAAPDAETWIVTALFFAAARWGNGEGIFNYQAEANTLLREMLHKHETSQIFTSMFDMKTNLVVFSPRRGRMSRFTNPSYHAPHFYELWARWTDRAQDRERLLQIAEASRAFWRRAAHPQTGLMPNYANFDGTPKVWGDYGEIFSADAWRCAMQVALDYTWFAADDWQIEQSNRLLRFFHKQGTRYYPSVYTLEGRSLEPRYNSVALVAMNATAALAATDPIRWDFVRAFWEAPLTRGRYRYYDNMLYMFALLQLSGNFRIYSPSVPAR